MTTGAPAKESFTGHERDGETGLVYAGARYLMPAVGRWTAVDPLASSYPSVSPYNYGMNNPMNLTDPTGACPEDGSAGNADDGDGYRLEEVVVTTEWTPYRFGLGPYKPNALGLLAIRYLGYQPFQSSHRGGRRSVELVQDPSNGDW